MDEKDSSKKRNYKILQTIFFKPFPNYKSDILSDGKQFVYRLGTLPLKESYFKSYLGWLDGKTSNLYFLIYSFFEH